MFYSNISKEMKNNTTTDIDLPLLYEKRTTKSIRFLSQINTSNPKYLQVENWFSAVSVRRILNYST